MSYIDLDKVFDKYFSSREEDKQADRLEKYGTKERTYFYASDIGFCGRKTAYQFFGLPRQTMSPKTLRVLENGEYLQQRYSQYFKDMGVWLGEEIPVSTAEFDDVPFLLSGRMDIMVNATKLKAIEMGEPYQDVPFEELTSDDLGIVEMKSINTWGFKRLAQTMMPETSHLYQITSYMWLKGVTQGWVIYEDKNDQNMLCIPVTYDERLVHGTPDGRIKGIIAEMTELAEKIEKKTVPARCADASQEKFPCIWKSGQCDYYNLCWDENGGEKLPAKANELMINGVTFDLENPPEGFSKDQLLMMADLFRNAVPAVPEIEAEPTKAEENKAIIETSTNTEANKADNTELFDDSTGVLNVGAPPKRDTTVEFLTESGEKAIICVRCEEQVTYKKLANGGTITCKHCGLKNTVVRG